MPLGEKYQNYEESVAFAKC